MGSAAGLAAGAPGSGPSSAGEAPRWAGGGSPTAEEGPPPAPGSVVLNSHSTNPRATPLLTTSTRPLGTPQAA